MAAEMAAQGALEVRLRLRRGPFLLVAELAAPPGVTALLGPSGSGKSTTLDLIAGHLRPDEGRVAGPAGLLFDSAAGVDLPPRRRRIGYVMQQPGLFPHLDVGANLAFGLAGMPAEERRRRVDEVAGRLGLGPLLRRRPGELSGGERQRVALGRALAPEPTLLLLDEPLSAVDGPARLGLLEMLREMLRAAPRPVLYVTHNEEEAQLLASRILFCRGRAPAPDEGAGLDRVVEIAERGAAPRASSDAAVR